MLESLESDYKIPDNSPFSLVASIYKAFRPQVLAGTLTTTQRQQDAHWAGERVFQSEALGPLLLKSLP